MDGKWTSDEAFRDAVNQEIRYLSSSQIDGRTSSLPLPEISGIFSDNSLADISFNNPQNDFEDTSEATQNPFPQDGGISISAPTSKIKKNTIQGFFSK